MAFAFAQERIDFQPIPFYYHGNPATIHVSSNDAVARGATATVLKAIMDTGVAFEDVALKVHPAIVTSNERELIRREMDRWRNLAHPRILPFYGTCNISCNQLALVSPFMANGNLCEYVVATRDVDYLRVISEVAEGLQYLHRDAKVVHGDIKCQNVLVSPGGNMLIADFGLSTSIDYTDTVTATYIRERQTIPFSAPELLLGDVMDPVQPDRTRSKTTMSDMYAYGGLIYQLYSGSPPWSSPETPMNSAMAMQYIIRRVCNLRQRPSRPTHPLLCDDVWEICQRCWAHAPQERPRVQSIVQALSRLKAGVLRDMPASQLSQALNPLASAFVPSLSRSSQRGVLNPSMALDEGFATRSVRTGVGQAFVELSTAVAVDGASLRTQDQGRARNFNVLESSVSTRVALRSSRSGGNDRPQWTLNADAAPFVPGVAPNTSAIIAPVDPPASCVRSSPVDPFARLNAKAEIFVPRFGLLSPTSASPHASPLVVASTVSDDPLSVSEVAPAQLDNSRTRALDALPFEPGSGLNPAAAIFISRRIPSDSNPAPESDEELDTPPLTPDSESTSPNMPSCIHPATPPTAPCFAVLSAAAKIFVPRFAAADLLI